MKTADNNQWNENKLNQTYKTNKIRIYEKYKQKWFNKWKQR